MRIGIAMAVLYESRSVLGWAQRAFTTSVVLFALTPNGEVPASTEWRDTREAISRIREKLDSPILHSDLLNLFDERPGAVISVEVLFDGDMPSGFELHAFFDGYATGFLAWPQVRALSERRGVRAIRIPARMRLM